jgi:hypothetical protein
MTARDEMDMRELADRMFVLQDYRRAYEIYKSLASKMEKRNEILLANLSEMIHLCLAVSKNMHYKLKNDPYRSIEKYAEHVLGVYEIQKRNKLKRRYLIFLVYVFHTFNVFDPEFIRRTFFSHLKKTMEFGNRIVSVLVHEQYANINLLFTPV